MARRVLRVRGRGLFREEWYSCCSMHSVHDETCSRCRVGSWENVWKVLFSGFVFRRLPKLWVWWMNRKVGR